MRLIKIATLIALSALLLASLPAFADSWTEITQPSQLINGVPYGGGFSGGPPAGCGPPACATTDFGGGNGSGGTIFSLGPFSGPSGGWLESNVPNTWATWNSPPFVESSTPNVLFAPGVFSYTMNISGTSNIVGFELEPDLFQQDMVTVTFHSADGASFPITLFPNGSAGALLFAAENTSGSPITRVDINDLSNDDFAIAQLRTGSSGPTTPEPSSILLLGSGILGLAGLMRRKMNL